MTSPLKLGVIGMPINHSLSPQIHRQFSEQFSDKIDYQKYEVSPESLTQFIQEFFDNGGVGLNVTLPHKQAVAKLVDIQTPEALLTGSVNTIFKNEDGKLVGDTTDGKGLLLDLERLNFDIKNKRILIIGAGGAAASIIASLLTAKAQVAIYNRTKSKAEALVGLFGKLGDITLIEKFDEFHRFDGVISSVSEFNLGLFESLSESKNSKMFFYDLNYGERAKPLEDFVNNHQLGEFSDGLGMLKGQAAYSYQHWTGNLPDIERVSL